MNNVRIAGWWIAAAVVAVVILFGSRLLALTVDWLWFGEIGQRALFWTILAAQAQLALLFGASLFLVMLFNIWLARRSTPSLTPHFTDYPLRIRLGRMARAGLSLALLAGALAVGILAALEATSHWDTWLRFLHPVPFGQVDPIFHRDLGFYIFVYPFWRFIYGRVFFGLLVVLAGTALVYYLDRAVEFLQGYARVAVAPRVHLSVLLGALMFVKAWGYRLDAYSLLLTPDGVVQSLGAGYTEVHARLPALNILFGLALLAGVAFLLNAHFRLLWLPVASIGVMVAASATVGTLFPSFVQRFHVTPDEGAVQAEYIRDHLTHTRAAYGLDRITMRDFATVQQLPPGTVQRNAVTIHNIRLWDYQTLQDAYQSLQSFLQFYRFEDVDIDRYRFGSQYREVMLSARELEQDRLDVLAQRWQNRRLEYTHGYGLVMSPVNEADTSGRPVMLVRDIPLAASVDLPITHPQIYYGELTQEPVVVRSRVPEFDYSFGGAAQTTRYEGKGGIPVGSWLTRLLFASHLGDTNLLISDAITSGSRLLIRRKIEDRVQRVAPFLMYDQDPYLAVADGRLIWIQDAYTTAETYPYSQPMATRVPPTLWPVPGDPLGRPEEVNYIRNSVKIVTDAYDGTMRFYVVDEHDPVIRSYQAIFPALWRPLAQMPPAIRAHIRYPETLFAIQSRLFATYHVTDPGTFYRRSDIWEVPPSPNLSGNALRSALPPGLGGPPSRGSNARNLGDMEPYYVTMRLPAEKEEEFLLILPLNFAGKPNMASWLAARSDGDEYGQLIAYVFPRGTQTAGVTQVAAFINQHPTISRELSLWNQQGSTVIWGNLLVMPIENSLLYVVPLFLSASQGGIPELKRVILSQGGKVVMGDTLAEAIQSLFQESPAEETTTSSSGSPSAPTSTAAPVPPRVRALADRAARQLEQAGAAQRRGDWAGYGAALKQLEGTLRELRRATGGAP
jgi:uncharacterized protein